jgi:hypothetical protein
MQMSLIDYLLLFALLIAAFYALYAAPSRRAYVRPLIRERKSKQANAERRRPPNLRSLRQDAAFYAFSR